MSQTDTASDVITIECQGIARPQGSKRHVGHGRMVESSKYVGDWRTWVRHCAVQAMAGRPPIAGPVVLHARFEFARPKSHFRKGVVRPDAPEVPIGKPDLSKLIRAIEDAMTGIVYDDDSRIAFIRCLKRYGAEARTLIEVQPYGCAR